ncbi:hypothetical protein [Oharaeibacter diazotrophicus]|uniref:Yip1-like protein n=1 Tax=Oharaeibacter diazotrophicus TaxID=1920512 RepID=A0A4R6R9A7_9HYPH|nr:hypothetical protein [Oharaeibacter diazotrophicus]TDP82559.1 hypothetical protein EDD54_3828 [Oharaeibacter diazotrophicus]BBE72677.1 hypothetical protein OHA_1_02275 [Pleomorphomonas sp. SM30]GLS76711.1 hypothetical protein GCM10007904_20480 [Oharaeibacter diazotrophicus]
MPSPDEIARAAGAAWALFRGDPAGLRRLDLSVDGFWRSFSVFVLTLPALGVVIAAERLAILEHSAYTAETFPAGAFLVSRFLGQILAWAAYPAVLALLARPLGFARVYVPLVVALNWSTLIAMVPATLPSLLYVLGLISGDAAFLCGLFALGVVLRYEFVVIRLATGAPVAFAAGLVALDYLVSDAIFEIAERIAGI